jgi:serine/threonine protein kinase
MRDIHHDNINAFIGACVDPGNVCILTEYCSRGSLKDILDNESVKLDNMFIASLIGDVVRVNYYLGLSTYKLSTRPLRPGKRPAHFFLYRGQKKGFRSVFNTPKITPKSKNKHIF